MEVFLNHHYYLEFFEDKRLTNVSNLTDIFDWFSPKYCQELDGTDGKIHVFDYHDYRILGVENLMMKTKVRGDEYYVYPLFLSIFKIDNRNILAIAYPYKALHTLTRDLQRMENVTSIGIDFHKIVDFMRNRGKNDSKDISYSNLIVSIIKYTALISKNVGSSNLRDEKSISKASHVYLRGSDPLDSDVYEHLVQTKLFNIEHLAGRLQLINTDIKSSFSVAFDQKGNFRFYLQKTEYEKSLTLILDFFSYLKSINTLIVKTRSSSNTLENNDFI